MPGIQIEMSLATKKQHKTKSPRLLGEMAGPVRVPDKAGPPCQAGEQAHHRFLGPGQRDSGASLIFPLAEDGKT